MTSPLLDSDQLATFDEIGFDDVKEILDDMVAGVPTMLEKIISALAEGNRDGGKSASHALRGMLLNFGCVALATRLRELEGNWPEPSAEAAQKAADLWSCWLQTQQALDAWSEGMRR